MFEHVRSERERDYFNGVKVPIMSSVYGYTKVLAHNLKVRKHQVLLLAVNGC